MGKRCTAFKKLHIQKDLSKYLCYVILFKDIKTSWNKTYNYMFILIDFSRVQPQIISLCFPNILSCLFISLFTSVHAKNRWHFYVPLIQVLSSIVPVSEVFSVIDSELNSPQSRTYCFSKLQNYFLLVKDLFQFWTMVTSSLFKIWIIGLNLIIHCVILDLITWS